MKLRPLYCDQLTHTLPSLKNLSPNKDLILLAETQGEATYVKHHKKKMIFQFSAMRHFAEELKAAGYQVRYVPLDCPENQGTFYLEILRAIKELPITEVVVTRPGEYRQYQDMIQLQKKCGLPFEIMEDNRFFLEIDEYLAWHKEQKHLLMENFYRMMRKKTKILMKGTEPEGGVWNLDKENRKKLPKDLLESKPIQFEADQITQEVIELIKRNFPDHFGDAEPFHFAVTAKDAEKAFDYFLQNHLYYFGDYQDTMKQGHSFLFHSIISPYLNAGLLDPKKVCHKVEKFYQEGKAPLNAAEGFIRQILGWREFIRGIYWRFMPEYLENNVMNFKSPLPEFYWTGNTKMNCLQQVIKTTKKEAYSHHIQRLMVTGNFALLAGCNPKEVHEWYLLVYADAYEWVELPNTIGMALHADGGIVGTKPYISSGAYINRMSDYCKNCHYNVRERLGEKACPFNSLYWHFLAIHQERFRKNPRMALAYRNLDNIEDTEMKKILEQAQAFLKNLE